MIYQTPKDHFRKFKNQVAVLLRDQYQLTQAQVQSVLNDYAGPMALMFMDGQHAHHAAYSIFRDYNKKQQSPMKEAQS